MSSAIAITAAAAFSLTIAAQPPASPDVGRLGHVVYDSGSSRLVFVESPKVQRKQRLWSLDGTRWSLLSGDGPPVRELEAVAFDAGRGRLVLHGGMVADGGDTMLSDLWEFDGRAWLRPEAQGPGARDHHAMAYDAHRSRIVLFGGRVSRDGLGDETWEYDGTSWRRFDVPGPGGRAHSPMVYDPAGRRVLLFGGMDQQGRARNDLWAWDGAAWTRLSDGGPPARTHHRLAFDERSGTLVLFGGLRGLSAFGDTWLWDGKAWRDVPAGATGPAKRSGHLMAWDPSRQRVVMLGGGYYAAETKTSVRHQDLWLWDGQRWTRES